MVPKHTAIAEVDGVLNCVAVNGDFVGDVVLIGRGAGGAATASAVTSDLIDIARGNILPPFGATAKALKPYKKAQMQAHEGGYYIRLSVYDRTGAFAAIASRMAAQGISIESIVQRRPGADLPGFNRRDEGAPAFVVMITHQTTEAAIRKALAAIERDGHVDQKPQMIRIEKL
jgi:homoserine dehydrogenase